MQPNPRTERDRGIDLLRGLALGRVFAWHATGYAALTWIAALPVMVFISGLLLARSTGKRPTRTIVTERLRRLLIPLWGFATVAWTAMAIGSAVTDTPIRWTNIISWLIPVTDPAGTEWENGWLSEPLWYIRMLIWLFLTFPLLNAAARKAPKTTIATFAALTVTGEISWGTNLWAAQDYTLFAAFFTAGMAVTHGTLPAYGRRWGWLAIPGLVATGTWLATRGTTTWVVNDSHTLHLTVGATTVALAGMALPALRTIAHHIPNLVDTVARRSLTIYLWHPAAIAITMTLTDAWRAWLGDTITTRAATAFAAAAVTATIVPFVGWLEDTTHKRTAPTSAARPRNGRSRRQTHRINAAVAATTTIALIVTHPLAPTTTTNAFTLPPPSQQPEQGDYSNTIDIPELATPKLNTPVQPGADNTNTTNSSARQTDRRPPDRLDNAAPNETGPDRQRWDVDTPKAPADLAATLHELTTTFATNHAPDGFGVIVVKPDIIRWAGQSGTTPHTPNHELGIMSVTKSFTAALVLQAVEDGRVTLDAPIGPLRTAPWFTAAETVTWRQLLNHTAGLRHYYDTKTWKTNPAAINSWETALRAVNDEGPTRFQPGTRHEYSSTNYIVAALALSEQYRTDIDTLLRNELLEPLGLTETRQPGPAPGSPATGTGGMTSTLHDLTTWGLALWRNSSLLAPETRAALYDIDPTSMFGAGSIAFCPCGTAMDGSKRQAAIGYNGGTVTVRYYPAWDTLIVVSSQTSIWEGTTPKALDDYTFTLAELANEAGANSTDM